MAKRAWPAKLAIGAVLSALGVPCAAAATFAVSIPTEPLHQALIDLALQTQLSVAETGLDFGKSTSRPISGRYTPAEALSNLLSGTGFTFVFVDATTVQIRSVERAQLPAEHLAANPEIVVVTATKRAEIAASLPYSFAVLTAQQIADSRAQGITQLTTEVAQLTATNLGAGQDKLFLRGLTDSVVPGLSESVVGVYLDDVRIGDDNPDPDLQLIDVDRVEVLAGPQGTLYGSGSLGGLVRIVTHQPDLDRYETGLSASVAQTKYGDLSDDASAVLNIPLVDETLALRTVAYARWNGGYIDENRLGIPNANGMAISGARAALKWQPNTAWSAVANVAYQRIHAGDAQYLEATSQRFERSNYLLEPHTDRFVEAGLHLAGDVGIADLVSATAVVDRDLYERFDASLAWPTLTGLPLGPSPFDDRRHIFSFTHETRVVSKEDGRWKWLFGAFLSHRDEDFESVLSGPTGAGARITGRKERREDTADEAALFGELTFVPTDQLSITAGIRAFAASRSVTASAVSLFGDGGEFRGTNHQQNATPKLVISYTPQSMWLLYAQISEGYRLGGLNVDGPLATSIGDDHAVFDSDTLWNYEIGAKGRFFEGVVVATAAAYFDKWRNVQADQVGRDGSFFVLNAGTIDNFGTEADVAVGPVHNLTVRGNFFWNNARLSNTNPLLVQTEGVIPASPRSKFGVTARYDLPIWLVDAFVAAEYGYVGRSHLGFDERAPTMGGYHIANLRIGADFGTWEALLFVDNLQREDENTFGFGNPFDPNLQVTPPRPRTIGLRLTWRGGSP